VAGERVPRRRAVTRERILQAAEAAFLETGFHRSSLESIAERAGYTTGAIYSSFRDRNALFLAVSENRYQRLFLQQLQYLGQSSSAEDFATALVKIYAEEGDTFGPWVAVALEHFAYAMRDPQVFAPLQAIVQRMLGEWERMLAPFASRSSIPAKKFAQILWALLNGLSMLRLADESVDDPELARLVVALMISGESAPPAG
jgi:AcrR family transcriptional regulator